MSLPPSLANLPPDDPLATFLASQVTSLPTLLSNSYVLPPHLDKSHPLKDYFIDSSHNTYLAANQLTGKSDVVEYENVIRQGARCVEIDAWPDEARGAPQVKVTHGYTLTSRVDLPKVLKAILSAFDSSSSTLPLVISLENHTKDDAFQAGMVRCFRETFGGRLVEGEVEDWKGRAVQLQDLEGKIFCMVEYHPSSDLLPTPGETSSSSSSDESDDEQTKDLRKKRKTVKGVIGPALASLGFYASSIKPGKGHAWLYAERAQVPTNPLINLSEAHLISLLPSHSSALLSLTSTHLVRLYPKGLRVFSHNLDPMEAWRHGVQVAALNFQTFDRARQVDRAMFEGSLGWVLKPGWMRGEKGKGRVRVGLTIGGVTGLHSLSPEPHHMKPYAVAKLYHSSRRHKARTSSVGLTKEAQSVVWDEHVGSWEVENDELVFLRVCLFDDIPFKEDPLLAVWTVRLTYVQSSGWGLVKVLDLKGGEREVYLALKISQEVVE